MKTIHTSAAAVFSRLLCLVHAAYLPWCPELVLTGCSSACRQGRVVPHRVPHDGGRGFCATPGPALCGLPAGLAGRHRGPDCRRRRHHVHFLPDRRPAGVWRDTPPALQKSGSGCLWWDALTQFVLQAGAPGAVHVCCSIVPELFHILWLCFPTLFALNAGPTLGWWSVAPFQFAVCIGCVIANHVVAGQAMKVQQSEPASPRDCSH